jgi:DNA-binding response OmpR family regulator
MRSTTERASAETAGRYNQAVNASVLIVEDEAELAQVLRDYLERAGFRVQTVHDGVSAISQFQHKPADIILLDLNLPGMDGLDVARQIRRKSDVPIIMVTARVEETDRLVGLEIGADDYIVKPFSPREVVARVRAVLRRAQASPSEPRLLYAADVEIDLERHRAFVGDREAQLTPTEFNLLAALVGQPGRAFTRLQLLAAGQGEAYEGYERTIDAHIKNLRAKIEPDPKVGYRFTDDR